MGRAPVIDHQMRGLICGLVSMGISRYRAAKHAGVSRSTMYRTMKHDAEFNRQVLEAELKQELSPLQQIRLHMPKDWRAAAWVAERQSTDWAKRAPDTVLLADMHGIFGAMMKLLLEGVRGSDDRKQVMENYEKFFGRLNQKRRYSPRVRRAIKELEADQQEQQARDLGPEVSDGEWAGEGPPPNDTQGGTDDPPRNVSGGEEIERDEP